MTKSHKTRSLIVGILLAVSLSGCGPNQRTDQSPFSATTIWSQQKAEIIDDDEKIIEFCIGPWHTAEETRLFMKPLMAYLEEKTGYRFILNTTENYEELVARFQNKHIDIANLSASLYDQILREGPDTSQYIATVTAEVGDKMTGHYQGIIFSHKDGPIQRLADLKGKSFAFVDQGSSSGFKYPLTRLVQAGLEPDRDFGEIFYMGNHDAVAQAVARRQVDAGAIWDLTLSNAEKNYGRIFNHLTVTNPIPREAWIAQKSVPKDLILTIQKALTELHAETTLRSGKQVFSDGAPFSGFVIHSEAFYSVVGETSSVVRDYLRKYPGQ